VLIAAGYWGYLSYKKIKNPTSPALYAISPNTFLFAEIIHPRQLIEKLTSRTELWKEILNIHAINDLNDELIYFDSIFSTESYINDIYEQHKFLIALNDDADGNISPVYIFEIPPTDQGLSIESFIKEINGEKSIMMRKSYKRTELIMVNISSQQRIFNYALYGGLFVGSFSEAALKEVIDQLISGEPVNTNERFKRIEQTAGKNVDANIYINYSAFSRTAGKFFSHQKFPDQQRLFNIGEWTETDLIIKSDELLLNGYTITPDSTVTLLNQFKQEPQEIKIHDILPFDISLMLHLGFENFEQHFLIRSKEPSFKEKFGKFGADLRKNYRIDVQQEIISWIGNEVAIAEKHSMGSNKNSSFVVIHSSDINTSGKSLIQMTAKIDKAKNITSFHRESGEYIIRKLNDPAILKNIFGQYFSILRENYYVILKDYVIFANNPTDLIGLINNFYNQKTLVENFNYQAFNNNISDRSNIYFYCNIRNSLTELSKYFNEEFGNILMKHQHVIRNFEGLAIQFSYINEMFYTNIYLKYNPTYQEVNPSNWEVELEGDVFGEPYFISNHKSGKLNVIAFDELNNMYLIDHVGQIQWKIPLMEAPLSKVYEIDYYKNGNIQYLINTKNYFYLIDLNGNYVADYPVKLITQATNPVVVLDYENDRNYRLILALSDNKLYNFDVNGKLVKGWNKVQTKVSVNQPIEHLVQGGKDYLFITDEKGNLTITNRRGEERIKVKNKFNKAKNSKFYVNRTNSKGIFISTNSKGKLVYITDKGKINSTDFGNFSEDHYFMYDFSGNNINDFIFVDGNTLTVLDRYKTVILGHSFEFNVEQPPILFEGNKNKLYLGVVNQENNEIIIFNENGLAFIEQNLYGIKSYIAGSLNKNDKIDLIIGLKNKVVNFQLE